MTMFRPKSKGVRLVAAVFALTFALQLPIFAETYPQEPPPDPTTADASAAESGSEDELKPVPYAKDEFPQWARDLRRAEIIAFGSLPFTLFFVKTTIDTYRYSQNDWDRRYAPWPLKSAGAIEMDEDQKIAALVAAGVSSIALALIDHIIVKIRRRSAERIQQSRVPPAITTEREGWPPEVELPPQASVPPSDSAPAKDDPPLDGER